MDRKPESARVCCIERAKLLGLKPGSSLNPSVGRQCCMDVFGGRADIRLN